MIVSKVNIIGCKWIDGIKAIQHIVHNTLTKITFAMSENLVGDILLKCSVTE